nr:reverse transcriptase domain-containing protein [Tanacetum cinerariifolium]
MHDGLRTRGVPRHIAEHRLNVREGCPLVRHKKRSQAPKRNMTIQEEVKRLVKADIMKEVHYHSWLSNLELRGIRGRSGDQEPHGTRNNKGYRRNIQDPKRNKHEVKSQEIHLQGGRSIKLGEYDIQYKPRISVKGQILVDFIMERPEDDSLAAPMEVEEELPDPWTLFTDESSCIDGSGAGLILTDPKGTEFTYALRFRFDATNNEAECKTLIASLIIAKQMGVKNLQTHMDSRLVANQINGSYIAKEPGMIQYLEKVKMLANSFKKFSIKQVPRSKDKKADTLSKITSTSFAHLTKQVLVEELKEKSINKAEVFGLPGEIISDNEKQFRYNPFKDWCEKLNIRQCFASVKHPKAKGLVERANRSLGEGVKARLDKESKDWIEETSHVLWAHHTMIKSSNEDTSFLLTYGTEAVISAKISMPTLRTIEVDMVQNDEALKLNLDLLEEKRKEAAIVEARSKAKMEKYYNSKVCNTSFKPGDLLYRNNDDSHAKDEGKLGPK